MHRKGARGNQMSHKHAPCLGCDICGICVAEQSIQLVQALEDKHKAYRKGIEDAAKVLEPMAGHHEQAYSGNKDLARGYRHAISVIRALLGGSK